MDAAGCLRQTGFMSSASAAIRQLPSLWPLQCAFGFAYWLLFVLALEPGNLMRAAEFGTDLEFVHESVRMLGAATLGALATPALLQLGARFPLLGDRYLHNLLSRALGVGALALVLIVVSCVLVAWAFYGTWLPTTADLRWQLANNWALLVYALVAQAAVAHLLRRWSGVDENATAPNVAAGGTRWLSHVLTKTRGRQTLVTLSQVDWIETQGNYLALHVGDQVHLLRQTITAIKAQLDPGRFVRVHRRALVALDRIQDLKPLTNGDATLRLYGGQLVRVSRFYRKQLQQMREAGTWE